MIIPTRLLRQGKAIRGYYNYSYESLQDEEKQKLIQAQKTIADIESKANEQRQRELTIYGIARRYDIDQGWSHERYLKDRLLRLESTKERSKLDVLELSAIRVRDAYADKVNLLESMAFLTGYTPDVSQYVPGDFSVAFPFVSTSGVYETGIVCSIYNAAHLFQCSHCMAAAVYIGLNRLCKYYARVNTNDYSRALSALKEDRLAIKQLCFLADARNVHYNVLTRVNQPPYCTENAHRVIPVFRQKTSPRRQIATINVAQDGSKAVHDALVIAAAIQSAIIKDRACVLEAYEAFEHAKNYVDNYE